MSAFNGPGSQPTYVSVSQLDPTASKPAASSNRPRVLTSFNTSRDPGGSVVDTNTAQPVRLKTFTGSPAATRVLTVTHLYSQQAWQSANYPAYHIRQAPAPASPSPSVTQATNQFNGFQSYSYAPAALAPSSDEFKTLSDPTKWQAVLDSWKNIMGLRTQVAAPTVPYEAPDQGDVTLLPANRPFVATLQTFCSQVLFGSTIAVGKNSVFGG